MIIVGDYLIVVKQYVIVILALFVRVLVLEDCLCLNVELVAFG